MVSNAERENIGHNLSKFFEMTELVRTIRRRVSVKSLRLEQEEPNRRGMDQAVWETECPSKPGP